MKLLHYLAIIFVCISCSNEPRTLQQEMLDRNCLTRTINLTIPNEQIDSLSLLKNYDEVPNMKFYNALLRVKKDGFFGMVDSLGREIIPPKFQWLNQYHKSNILVAKHYDSIYLVIRDSATLYYCPYKNIGNAMNGVHKVRTSNDLYGFIDYNGNEVIPAIYNRLSDVSKNGLVIASLDYDKNNKTNINNSTTGLINLKNEVIIPFKFKRINSFGNGNVAGIQNKIGQWAIVDTLGNFRTKFIYTDIMYYNKKLNIVTALKNTKFGLLDSVGKEITPFIYTNRLVTKGHIYKKQKYLGKNIYFIQTLINGKHGIINAKGKEILPAIYDEKMSLYFPTIVKRNGLCTFIDSAGKEVLEPLYEAIMHVNKQSKLIGVQKKGKWGFVDLKGNQIVEHKYTGNSHAYAVLKEFYSVPENSKFTLINQFGNEIIKRVDSIKWASTRGITVRINGKWGVKDTLGKTIIPVKYDEIGMLFYKATMVKKNGKYAVFSYKGKQLTPFTFDKVDYFSIPYWIEDENATASAAVQIDGLWGVVDTTGKIIEPITHKNHSEVCVDCEEY